MDANLQTNRRQWSKRLDMDKMCAKAKGGMAGEGLKVRGRERVMSVVSPSDVTDASVMRPQAHFFRGEGERGVDGWVPGEGSQLSDVTDVSAIRPQMTRPFKQTLLKCICT